MSSERLSSDITTASTLDNECQKNADVSKRRGSLFKAVLGGSAALILLLTGEEDAHTDQVLPTMTPTQETVLAHFLKSINLNRADLGKKQNGISSSIGISFNIFYATQQAKQAFKTAYPNVDISKAKMNHKPISNGGHIVIYTYKTPFTTRDIDSSQKLRVNTDDTHYRIKKSREEGEGNIFELCDTSKKEELWAFIKYSNGKSYWQECGYDEEVDGANADLAPIMEEITKRQSEVVEVSIYHHHPVDKLSKHNRRQTPSGRGRDITSHFKIMKMVAAYCPKLANKVDFRIVTSTGIYVIKSSPEVLKNQAMQEEIADNIRRERETFPHFNYHRSNRHNFHTENANFAKRFSNALVEITFNRRHQVQR